MALTATADRLTRNDISNALGLHDPFRWTGSFDRPNISLKVVNDPGKRQRLRIIADLITKYHLDSGIVYCLSRKKRKICTKLSPTWDSNPCAITQDYRPSRENRLRKRL